MERLIVQNQLEISRREPLLVALPCREDDDIKMPGNMIQHLNGATPDIPLHDTGGFLCPSLKETRPVVFKTNPAIGEGLGRRLGKMVGKWIVFIPVNERVIDIDI